MSRPPIPTQAALHAKLSPPASSPGHVARQAVCDRVCASPSVKVILFRAPAGFGKTTAMMQCRARLEETGVATAWLTLDAADNDASRFLACLAAAAGNITDEAPADGANAPRWLGEVALDVVNRLAGHPSPFAIFLDDFEFIQEPGALGMIREIIGHLPRRGQLVIGSRSVPELALGRLRAREQLLEIDARELRFSMDETVEFFARRRPTPLLPQDLSRLHQKTEGWAAALSLASLALERHEAPAEFIERFSGSNEAVAEYLAEDVLSRQPAHVRAFLLRTSILRELHPALCGALLPEEDCEGILQQLERANLFLSPIAGAERRYRYHSLFAAFLRAQLAAELPAELPRLHRAAAGWYESQERPVPAINHALEAGDFNHAVALLSRHAEELLAKGRLRLLSRWFGALPADVLRKHAVLQVVEVWALALTRGPREAMALLQRTGCERSRAPEVLAYVLSVRPMLLAMMDRYEEAHAAGRESLERLPESNQFARMALSNAMAEIFSVMGLHDDARKLLDTARRAQGERESTFNVMYSESVEGMIDLQEGRLRQATARFRMAVGATHAASFGHTSGNAWAGVLYALAVYEANELDQAARLLSVYVPLVRDVGLPDHMILGYGMLTRIAFCRGEVDEAFQLLTELEYLGQRRQLPRVVAGAKLERARVLLQQGHGPAAMTELERADDKRLWERVERLRQPANDLEYMNLARLRWEVLAGEPRAALPRLEQELAAASAATRRRRALKLRLLQAIALKRCGEEREALSVAGELLRAACAEGFLRLILDEGEEAGVVVRQLDDRLREDGAHRREPTFGEYLRRLRDAFGPGVTEAEVVTAQKAALLEPLTPKEISVLQLLAEGYSNGAMAEKLFVADTTIRTHLRNINGKLSASSRTHAVAVARRMGIIG